MIEHRIPDGVGAMPLPRYLSRAWPMIPGWALREGVKKRDFRLNGKKWDGSAQVKGGDVLNVFLPEKYLTGPLTILYQDEELLAVEKPAGLPVDVDDMGIGADTALNRARAICPGANLCHRLDAGTGGALFFALNEEKLAEMHRAFADHQVKKTYQALVMGVPPRDMELTHYLKKDGEGARVRAYNAPVPGAVKARLGCRLLQSDGERSLVEIRLFTGRTHQIRVQMAQKGFPLLGDDKYGNRNFNKKYGKSAPLLWCVGMEYREVSVHSPAPFSLEPSGQGVNKG